MTPIKTSVRAFAAALGPFLVLHLMTIALLAPSEEMRFRTPDAALAAIALRLGADAVLFGVLHFGLRALGIGRRGAYALIGATAGVGSYALGLWTGWWPRLAPEGATITTAIAPLLTGAVAGTMYHVFAGYQWRASTGAPGASGQWTEPRPIPTFAGPVQVRTSAAAFAIVTLVPPLVVALLMLLFSVGHLSSVGRVPVGSGLRWAFGGMAAPLAVLLGGLGLFSLPTAVLVAGAHALARAGNRLDYRSYALIGFGCAALWPLLLGGRGGAAGASVMLGLFGAGASALYRRFAGLEPKPLPEHLLVRDREALVPAGDPARHTHRVVFES